MPQAVFVLDDTLEVPPAVASVAGIDRFGTLLHDRRRLADRAVDAARSAGFSERVCLRDAGDRHALSDAAAESPSTRYVLLTSDIVGTDPDKLSAFVGKLAYAERDLVAQPPGAGVGSCVASLSAGTLRRLLACRTRRERHAFFADRRDDIERIGPDGLAGIADPASFARLVSGSFYTRAFNAVRDHGRTLTKASSDVDKLTREHDWWYLLPPALQRMAVQPFDLQLSADRASYRMERLNIPDMAVVWVHGPPAMADDAFEGLLDAVFEWFGERPALEVTADRAQAAARALYVDKLDARMARLLATDVGKRVDAAVATGLVPGGLAALAARYRALLDAEWARGVGTTLSVMHGDLCFSNVLYDQRTRLLRLIDPRGASEADELWGDPYYDLAKLSHSILGRYDFLNHGLFDVVMGDDLRFELRIDGDRAPNREALFVDRVREAGFDPRRMRLYEASLFLSMLPLHAEDPRKLLAFAITAEQVLDQVEAWPSGRRTLLQRVLG